MKQFVTFYTKKLRALATHNNNDDTERATQNQTFAYLSEGQRKLQQQVAALSTRRTVSFANSAAEDDNADDDDSGEEIDLDALVPTLPKPGWAGRAPRVDNGHALVHERERRILDQLPRAHLPPCTPRGWERAWRSRRHRSTDTPYSSRSPSRNSPQ